MTDVPLDVETLEALERGELSLAEAFDIPLESLVALEKKGLGLFHQGRYTECIALFELLEGLGRTSAASAFLLSVCEGQRGNLAASQRHFQNGERLAIAAKDSALVDLAKGWATTAGVTS